MSFNLTTSYAILNKAGTGANSTAASSAIILAKFCDEAEATFCGRTRKDWVTNAATANFLGMIDDAVSDLAAIKLISYDMSGYTSRSEAQTMLDVLKDNSNQIIKQLEEEKNRDIIS